MESIRPPEIGSGAPLFLGPGGYRLGAWITFAVFLLVFGVLWGLVAIDHFRTREGGSARFLVVSVVCPLIPAVALVWGLGVNRRGRRRYDFDTVVSVGPDLLAVTHSFDGRRCRTAWA